MPKRIDWERTAREWSDEVTRLEALGEDRDYREYREALRNLRSAERRAEAEKEKQEERDRYDTMPVKDAAKAIADRLTDY